MRRKPDSHKGENGLVAIIGGSKSMHGAPIMAALAAEASGVDLVYLSLPSNHIEAAKTYSLNFQVHGFKGDDLSKADVKTVLELLANVDCAIIGPGIAKDVAAIEALADIVAGAVCPLVLDAAALQSSTLNAVAGKNAVLTPHLGELERMGLALKDIGRAAKENGATIFVKGQVDHLAFMDGAEETIEGGNAGLTVGGTGDVLAGLIGGLIAKHMSQKAAALIAGKLMKQAGTNLSHEKGYAYTAHDVINQIPHLLHTYEVENP